MRTKAHRALVACFGVCLVLVASCGSEGGGEAGLPAPCARVGNPDFTGPGYGVIGPAGGAVEQTDRSSEVAGVRVEVAPGAWKDCWEVRIGYATIFETPDYPRGYVPFGRPGPSGAVDVAIGLSTLEGFERAPGPLPIQISFPMQGIHPEVLDVRSAYFYDSQGQSWRIVLPGALTRERMTVATTAHDVLWSWGRVDLGEVDFEQHMKPALAGYYGNETLTAIQNALDTIRNESLRERWELSCAGLGAAQAFFTSARDRAAADIDRIQASLGCGPCNPLSEQFQEELEEWWKVKRWDVALDLSGLVTMRKPADVLQVALTPLIEDQQEWVQCLFDPLGCALDLVTPETACDYECYFKKVPSLQMNVDKGVYHACDWLRGIVERYRTRVMDPPCR